MNVEAGVLISLHTVWREFHSTPAGNQKKPRMLGEPNRYSDSWLLTSRHSA